MTFHIGQRVVCIAKGEWKKTKTRHPGAIVPERGKIYTIREIYRDPFYGGTGIRLTEIVNADFIMFDDVKFYMEIGWLPEEFRPLEEKKTDISIFRKLLNPNKAHENS